MANLNAPLGNRKIYRLETSVLEFLHNFRKEKQFSRTVEVYHLNKKENYEYYKLLCTEFLFKDEENADVILLKKLKSGHDLTQKEKLELEELFEQII